MVPLLPETVAAVPSARTPEVLPIDMGTDGPVVEEARVTLTTATVPLLIAVEFMPTARQVMEPVAALQVSVLPADVKAGPAETLRAAISPGA